MDKETMIEYLKNHYPHQPTEEIATTLGVTKAHVHRIASRLKIRKNPEFIKELRKKLVTARREWYLSQIPILEPTLLQEQVIYGSLLGDGSLTTWAPRSEHCSYREHFSPKQLPYRRWKEQLLAPLGFHITDSFHLRSYSHPYFTNLYEHFYENGVKVIPKKLLSDMNHPIFLATLYMDDGTLSLSHRYSKKKGIVYVHPAIVLYTQNFKKEENVLLAKHLNETFETHFVLSKRPDGHQYVLKLNKVREVEHFLSIVRPYVSQITNLQYKYDLHYRLRLAQETFEKRYGKRINVVMSSSKRSAPYSKEEITKLTHLKAQGYTDREISEILNRSYWSVVYKLVVLRKKDIHSK